MMGKCVRFMVGFCGGKGERLWVGVGERVGVCGEGKEGVGYV